MSNEKGPTPEEIRLHEAHAAKARETAKAMSPYIEGNKLNPDVLKHVLDKHAPGNDAEEDGVYQQPWLATDTFYRFTEEYVPLVNRLAFKMELERMFPGKQQGR